MWKFPFAQVIFDTDPAVIDRGERDQGDEMSQAMIRSKFGYSRYYIVYYISVLCCLQRNGG